MTFLTKLKKSAKSIAGASLCVCVIASICQQDEVADAAASVFWTSVATAVGSWFAEEIQVAVA
jgi:hypothetical protein